MIQIIGGYTYIKSRGSAWWRARDEDFAEVGGWFWEIVPSEGF